MQYFGIADCNNFYCSCERVFRPDLRERPVVVLSNNDGCIIARSEEAKALGIAMGTPFYQAKAMLETHGAAVFSSNYTLYGSMSARVMSLLSQYTPKLQIYSIDEAFLLLSDDHNHHLKQEGEQMAARIYKSTGIPISVGIAPTKTLAKMASKFAKKYPGYKRCCLIDTDEKRLKALQLFRIDDVWGIGRQIRRQLEYHSIHTAADFAAKKESWVRSKFNVTTLRTWKELNGISCIDVDDLPWKKSICTSRSFAHQGITDAIVLEEAVANFASMCATKLRKQRCCCQSVTVFAHTSRFRTDVPCDMIHATMTLTVPTQANAEIINAALTVLRKNMRRNEGKPFAYKKAGVILWNITPQSAIQQDLFDPIDRQRQAALTKAIDEINRKNGYNTVRLASQGTDIRFSLLREHISKNFTTNINDVLVAKV